jgi:hypothetical protein
VEKHVTVVGILRIGMSALGLLVAVVLFVIFLGAGLATWLGGEEEALPILLAVALGVGGVILVLSVPGIVGGVGVLRYKNWARYLVLVLSVFDLINIPIGTIVGIYSIWVLVRDDTVELFESRASVENVLEGTA